MPPENSSPEMPINPDSLPPVSTNKQIPNINQPTENQQRTTTKQLPSKDTPQHAITKTPPNKKFLLLMLLIIIAVILTVLIEYFSGSNLIKTKITKNNNLVTYYYINIAPTDNTVSPSDHTNVFRLRSEIEKLDCQDSSCNKYTSVVRVFVPSRTFLPSSGNLIFYGCELQTDNHKQCLDQYGNSWSIELTHVKYK